MDDLWKEYAADFNTMSDEDIDIQEYLAQQEIDEQTSWIEAVASWKAAGKPRSSDD